jgi:DNA-binding NarL/FixJ family response regulator
MFPGHSGRTKYRLVRLGISDAVILDYQMPEMKGDRVATQMKLAKPDVPIVLHPGDESLPEDVLQSSVEAFVAKGESPVTLLATVRGLLTGARHPLLAGSATGNIAPASGARA